MYEIESSAKHNRVLELGIRFLEGELINKRVEAEHYQVNERSIQRDLDDLRAFFLEKGLEDGAEQDIVYDRLQKGYRLKRINKKDLTNSEALAVCKILLESRAFTRAEMETVLDKIIRGCVPKKNFQQVMDLISNEKFYYIEPQHKQKVIDRMWEIGRAIQEQLVLAVEYERQDGSVVQRLIEPVGIMFSEFYFYLTAFIENIDKAEHFSNQQDLFPTIYRIDRIRALRLLKEHFELPYRDRFQEGEFRKRVQFMYGGRLQQIKFEYSGPSPEAVLDRLPTAVVTAKKGGRYLISAEVFGSGIEAWLRSQGSLVKVLEPKDLVERMRAEAEKCRAMYEK